MSVLILGGAGFVGANLARACLKHGHKNVTIFDSLDDRLKGSTEHLEEIMNEIHFIKGDIRDENALLEVVKDAEIIYHCAAQTSHSYSLKDPLFDIDVNCTGTIKLLETIRRFNSKARVVYLSTTTVIGKSEKDIVDEHHHERPTEIYSANKGVAEKYYQIYNRVHGLNTYILRFPNLYGAYGKPYPEFNFINYFISRIWGNSQIEIFGTGSSIRNVLYVEDATDLLLNIVEHDQLCGEIFFATSPFHHSVRSIAETTISIFERGQLKIVPWPEERKVIEVGDQRFSANKLTSKLDWTPKFSLEEGLKAVKSILLHQESRSRKVAI